VLSFRSDHSSLAAMAIHGTIIVVNAVKPISFSIFKVLYL